MNASAPRTGWRTVMPLPSGARHRITAPWKCSEAFSVFAHAMTLIHRGGTRQLPPIGPRGSSDPSSVRDSRGESRRNDLSDGSNRRRQRTQLAGCDCDGAEHGPAREVVVGCKGYPHMQRMRVNEQEGYIALHASFSSGHVRAPAHDGCRCSLRVSNTVEAVTPSVSSLSNGGR